MFKSWIYPFTFQAHILPHTLTCICVSLFKFQILILKQFQHCPKQAFLPNAYCLKLCCTLTCCCCRPACLLQADSCSYSSRGCLLLKRARRLGFPITRLSSTAPLLYYYSAATFLKSLQGVRLSRDLSAQDFLHEFERAEL